mmetsp:Transcript_26888/g.61907  ORF Transcript_26888/g.61907 Transcript_26888/m.61907 type:complete len:461 (-) Transcript_26888:538-1920(-)
MSQVAVSGKNIILYRFGNTYQRIPNGEAKLNRKGTHKKIHDWVLFFDVIHGNVDLIQSVCFELNNSFKPNAFTCSNPIEVTAADGSRIFRFKTRQQSTAAFVATIVIRGNGGSEKRLRHRICILEGGKVSDPNRFVEAHPQKLLPMPIISDHSFGIELELSCRRGASHQQIANSIFSKSGIRVAIEMEYSRAHQNVSTWKLVRDGSINCSPNNPNCTKFELVSPILRGEAALNDISKILRAFHENNTVDVNKSMGFHVHIGVQNYPLSSLIKLCQNFIKYEDAIDSIMPPSRRTGSNQSKHYFKSNKYAVREPNATNADRHKALSSCTTIAKLCRMMNPTGRYYKLNMQNLVSGRQPTIEFRQHSATSNDIKVKAWVRFCMLLTTNSHKNAAPRSLKSSRTVDEQFDMLFQYVIKDRALKNYFLQRRSQVRTEHDDGGCCSGCIDGHGCDSGRRVSWNLS